MRISFVTRIAALSGCVLAAGLWAGCDSGPEELTDGGTANAAPSVACERRSNHIPRNLLECVTIEGVREHLMEFQAFADANGGNRWDGTPGWEASADYVAGRLDAASWSFTRLPVSYPRLVSALSQVAPIAATYTTGAFSGTGEGDVTASVVAVDINLTPPRDNTSGCEAADFAGFPAGSIALLQRGVCTFADKVLNAQAAGASGVIIFNQGNTPDREGLIVGTLLPTVATIPVVGASFADGVALAQPGSVARVFADIVTVSSETILAERVGSSGRVIMAGAHLDSWPSSPGINSNGSGAAVLLEIAQNLGNTRTPNTLRFAFWGGYSAGLVGSDGYVQGLSTEERDAIAMYMNVESVASPNFVRFILDGDGSTGSNPAPVPGSEVIESFWSDFFAARGLASESIDWFASDHVAFALAGIPYSSLFAGTVGLKTAEQAATYGGTAGVQYDPCYQLACDNISNVNLTVLDQNADAAAAAILHFGTTSELPARGGSTSSAQAGPVVAEAAE